ncbi:MAG: InlB B-repeat-containing protein, partial [Acidimicrobiales bacterium]
MKFLESFTKNWRFASLFSFLLCLLVLLPSTPVVASVATTHTVTFAENDNGSDQVGTYQLGTSPQPLTLFSNLSPSFSNPGYTFSGWNTQSDGLGTSYANGATYSFSSDMELYAQWTPVITTY